MFPPSWRGRVATVLTVAGVVGAVAAIAAEQQPSGSPVFGNSVLCSASGASYGGRLQNSGILGIPGISMSSEGQEGTIGSLPDLKLWKGCPEIGEINFTQDEQDGDGSSPEDLSDNRAGDASVEPILTVARIVRLEKRAEGVYLTWVGMCGEPYAIEVMDAFSGEREASCLATLTASGAVSGPVTNTFVDVDDRPAGRPVFYRVLRIESESSE